MTRLLSRLLGAAAVLLLVLLGTGGVASAAPQQAGPAVVAPLAPAPAPAPGGSQPVTTSGGAGSGTVRVDLDKVGDKPSQPIVIILLLTLLSVAPALLVLCTSFTKIIVVLSLTRNALGTPTIPPNQVLAGLALFLSLFVMSPVLSQVNSEGVQPYLKGEKSQSVAAKDGVEPLRAFMLKQTRKPELSNMVQMSAKVNDTARPATPKDVPLTTLIPAFVLSELKSAFIIGFVVFIPFLIIDLVVSSSLMSMGMMMLPPVLISLPFKLLLFVMIDGWGLITRALVSSYG